jgi:hypothetical protein
MLDDRYVGTPFAYNIYVNDDRRPPDAETAAGSSAGTQLAS